MSIAFVINFNICSPINFLRTFGLIYHVLCVNSRRAGFTGKSVSFWFGFSPLISHEHSLIITLSVVGTRYFFKR